MNRIIIILLGYFLSCSVSPAQLTWDNLVQEYKAKPEDHEFQTEFKFTNKTSKPIRIVRVASSCGCTSALQNKTNPIYGPGESGVISAKFDFGIRSGLQTKEITINTDDPANPTYKLVLKVTIPQLFTVYPTYVIWSVNEEPMPKPVYIKITHSSPIHIQKVVSTNPAFNTELRVLKDGAEYLILVTPPADKKPVANSPIQVLTDFPQSKPRNIAINAEVKAFPAPSAHSGPPGFPPPLPPTTVGKPVNITINPDGTVAKPGQAPVPANKK